MLKIKTQSGFTLIELLISIAIFSLLSTFMVIGFQNNEKARSLKEQADLVFAGIDQARNLSLAGSGPDNVYSQQFVFTLNNNCQNDCSYTVAGLNPAQAIVTKNLTKVSVAINNESDNTLDITFAVPRGRMTLSGHNPTEAKIELASDDLAYCVLVNSISGKVEEISGNCP